MIARAIRVFAAGVCALTLVVGGTLAAHAYWRSTATVSTSVASGSVAIALSAPTALNGAYSSTNLVRFAPLTVTNTGTVSENYTVTSTGTGSAPLAGAIQVSRWPVASAAACTATPGPGAATGSWSSFPTMSGTLAPGSAQVWCVRTSLTNAQLTPLVGTTIQATLTAVGALGSWAASASQTVAQNVATATMACTPNGSPWAVTVSWNPPAGWPYHLEELWVDGDFFTAQNSNFTFRYVDWDALASANGATPGNPQTFTLQARALNPATGQWLVIAERTVVTRVIDYGTYSHNVVECS